MRKNFRDIEEARPACRFCRCSSTSTIVDVVRNSRNDARNVAVPPQRVAAAVFGAAVAAAPAVKRSGSGGGSSSSGSRRLVAVRTG